MKNLRTKLKLLYPMVILFNTLAFFMRTYCLISISLPSLCKQTSGRTIWPTFIAVFSIVSDHFDDNPLLFSICMTSIFKCSFWILLRHKISSLFHYFYIQNKNNANSSKLVHKFKFIKFNILQLHYQYKSWKQPSISYQQLIHSQAATMPMPWALW